MEAPPPIRFVPRPQAKQAPGRTPQTLSRNTAAQVGSLSLGYLYSFLSAPVIVAGLGIRQFGIWALTGALVQYAGLLNVGGGDSVARFVARHEKDRRACGEYIVVGALSVVALTVPLLGASFAFAPLISSALHVGAGEMRVLLCCSAILLFCSMLTTLIGAYPVGLRRMMAPNIGLMIGLTINFVASVGSIALGVGLQGYAEANAGAGIAGVLIVTAAVLRAERTIPIAWPRWSRTKELLGFAIRIQVVRVTELVNYQTDKIVIGFAIGTSAAGAYELANRVAAAARQIGVYPLTALVPTLSAELSGGLDRIRARYRRLLMVTVTAGFAPLVLTAAVAPLLLTAWLGHAPANSTAVLFALPLGYLANISSGVAFVIAAAAGEPGIAARASAGTAVLNVVLTASLAPIFGIWGVLAGTVVALSAGALAQIAMVHGQFGLSFGAWREAVLPTLGVCVLLAAPVALISYTVRPGGRFISGAVLVLLCAAYAAVYAGWAVRTGRVPRTVLRWRSGRGAALQEAF